jgi:hypothetical protein
MKKNKPVFDHFKLKQQLAQLVFNDMNGDKKQVMDDLICFGRAMTIVTTEGIKIVPQGDIDNIINNENNHKQ